MYKFMKTMFLKKESFYNAFNFEIKTNKKNFVSLFVRCRFVQKIKKQKNF